VAERLDDMRGLRLKDPLRPTWPVWINLFFICFGLFVIVTQTLALLAGKPGDSYDFLFGWNLGSWGWLGRLVVLVGWVLLVHLHAQDLLRKRRGRGGSRG
jgi:hypothetical protein